MVLLATGNPLDRGQQGPQITPDKDQEISPHSLHQPALGSLLHCFHLGLTHISKINWQLDKDYEVDEFLELLTIAPPEGHVRQEMNHGSVRTPQLPPVPSSYLPRRGAQAGPDSGGACRLCRQDRDLYFQQECIHRALRHYVGAQQAADVELILHGSMISTARVSRWMPNSSIASSERQRRPGRRVIAYSAFGRELSSSRPVATATSRGGI